MPFLSEVFSNNQDFLELILEIDGEDIKGEVKSTIIDTYSFIFFFDDNGKCVKKITKKAYTYQISSNRKYITLLESVNKGDVHYPVVSLYDYRGKLQWRTKELPDGPRIFRVANDGKRALGYMSPYEESDYPITVYFGEDGKELIVLNGMIPERIERGDERAISDNCRYFICCKYPFREDVHEWYFYGEDGKLIRKEKTDGRKINAIGDNGNYVMIKYEGEKTKAILYDINGKIIKDDFKSNDLDLAKEGTMIFYTTKSGYVFDNFFNEYTIFDEIIIDLIGNRDMLLHQICKNISYYGNMAIITTYIKKNDFILVFLFRDESIKMIDLGLGKEFKSYELLNGKDLLAVRGNNYSKLKLYKIKF